jgi:hypothetical protein
LSYGAALHYNNYSTCSQISSTYASFLWFPDHKKRQNIIQHILGRVGFDVLTAVAMKISDCGSDSVQSGKVYGCFGKNFISIFRLELQEADNNYSDPHVEDMAQM